MGVKKDTVQVTLQLDSKQAINQLGKLEMEYADVRRTLKGLKKDHKDYQNLKNKEKELTAAIRRTRQELGLQGMTLGQLIRHERDLQRTRTNSTTRGTAEYKRLTAEIRKANAMIRQQKMEARGMTGIWNSLSKEIKQFGMIALGYLGITAITSQISNLIQRTGDFSDLLASVQKTTGMTRNEVEELNEALGKVDTRTARKQMLEMAKVAGKLGITARKDVEGFVRAFDKINVALGEDLGNPEDVARKLGKLMESFNINKEYDIETGLLKVGSAINHLGKSSTANEGYIVEFTRRMAGIAPLANLSIQDVMGLGATLDALGQTSEVSSTSLNKLFIKMTQNSEIFAQYAKDANGAQMSAEQFQQLIETDFNEAFISLLRGVKDNSQGMTALSETLGDLELDGGRVIGVLGTLANNTDLLYKQQKISNDEFERGTSVLDEFNLMNETAGALLDKVRKRLFAAFVNSRVIKGLENLVGWIERVTRPDLVESLREEQAELNNLVRAIQNVNDDNEIRSKLIQELQEKYPDFLGNLDAESVSNLELETRLKAVNNEYRKKIILQSAEDELTEMIREQVDLMDKRLTKEKELADYRKKIAEDPSYGMGSFMNPQDEINDLDRAIANIDEQIAEAEQRRNELLKAFKLDVTHDQGGPPDPDPDPDPSPDPDNKKLEAYQKYIEKLKDLRKDLDIHLLESEQQEIANVERKYEELMNEARAFHDAGITTEEEYLQTIAGLNLSMDEELTKIFSDRNAKYLEERQKLKDELGLELLGDKEKEIAQVEAHYDALIDEAKKYHLSIVELERAKQAAIDGIRSHYRDIEVEANREAYGIIANNIADSLSSIASMQSENTEKGIKNQQALANAAIIASQAVVFANQAAALSAAIKGAAEASAATGPLAPITLVGYIAAMTATVLGAFSSIKKNNTQARDAISSLREEKAKEKSNGRSYYHGGEVDDYGRKSYGDSWGQFSGYNTHPGEFVTPAYVRSDPGVVDAVKVIKARMAGYAIGGGSTNVNSTATLDADRFDKAVSRFEAKIDVLIREGLRSYFTPREIERADENKAERESSRSRASLRS